MKLGILHFAEVNLTMPTEAIVMDDLKPIKEKYGIKPDFRSCHTAVSKDGYVFEGHVPAKLVKQFLSQPRTDAIGLSVPAMVVGSPGMEMGEKFMPYQVLLLKKGHCQINLVSG